MSRFGVVVERPPFWRRLVLVVVLLLFIRALSGFTRYFASWPREAVVQPLTGNGSRNRYRWSTREVGGFSPERRLKNRANQEMGGDF